MTIEQRLFGEPGDEVLHFDIDVAWERATGDVIEEHTVHPTTHHLPSVDGLLEWVSEWSAENGELDEYGSADIDEAMNHGDVEDAVRALYAAISGHVTYRMADEVVATHRRIGPRP